jgi:hypothetical protein
MSKHSKPPVVSCFIHRHTNSVNEHVVMSGVYGTSAAAEHSWIGSIAVAVGYFYVYLSGKSAHKCTLPTDN